MLVPIVNFSDCTGRINNSNNPCLPPVLRRRSSSPWYHPDLLAVFTNIGREQHPLDFSLVYTASRANCTRRQDKNISKILKKSYINTRRTIFRTIPLPVNIHTMCPHDFEQCREGDRHDFLSPSLLFSFEYPQHPFHRTEA